MRTKCAAACTAPISLLTSASGPPPVRRRNSTVRVRSRVRPAGLRARACARRRAPSCATYLSRRRASPETSSSSPSSRRSRDEQLVVLRALRAEEWAHHAQAVRGRGRRHGAATLHDRAHDPPRRRQRPNLLVPLEGTINCICRGTARSRFTVALSCSHRCGRL